MCYNSSMKFRENYWSWMYLNLRFARYDRRFIREVYNRRIAKNRAVTPRQAELWETLVYKYRQQILQANIDPDAMLSAPWQILPQALPPGHQRYELIRREHCLIMRSPYNAEQVEAWRNFRASHNISDESWDPDAREWIIPITAGNLKNTLTFCSRPAQPYDIAQEVLDLIDPVLSLSNADQWRVQARLVNNSIMINCANQYLLTALPQDLPLTLSTLNILVRAGVDIHEDLCQHLQLHTNDAILTQLNSQQSTALPWSQENHQAIMQYIEQNHSDNIILELIEDGSAYQKLCQEILARWPNRAQVYHRWKSRDPEWEFFTDQFDYENIDFDSIDIAINKSRSLIAWDVGALPAQVARKNIYYIDPQHDREDYLDGTTTW